MSWVLGEYFYFLDKEMLVEVIVKFYKLFMNDFVFLEIKIWLIVVVIKLIFQVYFFDIVERLIYEFIIFLDICMR